MRIVDEKKLVLYSSDTPDTVLERVVEVQFELGEENEVA